jgi:hypothetical protein
VEYDLLFCDGSWRDVKDNLELYYKVIGMKVNSQKYSVSFNGVEEDYVRLHLQLFPYQHGDFQVGFKYLGFFTKPNDYAINS